METRFSSSVHSTKQNHFPTVSFEISVRGSEESNTSLKTVSNEDDTLETGTEDKEEAFLKAAKLVATKIRFDVKDAPGHNTYEGLDLEHMKAVTPDSLFLILQLLAHGCEENEVLKKPAQFKRVMSIAQDVIFAASNGKKLTPKHIGVVVAIHKATRLKSLIQLLAAATHTGRYEKVQEIDTSIANTKLKDLLQIRKISF